MNFLILLIAFVILVIFLLVYLKFSSFSTVLDWLQAKPCPNDPVWMQVKDLLREISRDQRMKCPELLVLPEFSPNALALRAGKTYILVSEGMVRTLSREELQAALSLCLAYSKIRGTWIKTRIALLLFPIANLIQSGPLVIQYMCFPIFSMFLRIWIRPERVRKADQIAAKQVGMHRVAAMLQKMSVLGRKIPIRRWNIALDHLFLLSPLVLENDPFWIFPTQLTIEQRRQFLASCESVSSLP